MTEIFGPESSGKGLPYGEEVLACPKGSVFGTSWMPIEGVKVGDHLATPYGGLAEVTEIFYSTRPIYEAVFDDGATFRCDDQHLWYVQGGDNYEVIPIQEVISRFEEDLPVEVPLVWGPVDLIPPPNPDQFSPLWTLDLGILLSIKYAEIPEGRLTFTRHAPYTSLLPGKHSLHLTFQYKPPFHESSGIKRESYSKMFDTEALACLEGVGTCLNLVSGSHSRRGDLLQGILEAASTFNPAEPSRLFLRSKHRLFTQLVQDLSSSLGFWCSWKRVAYPPEETFEIEVDTCQPLLINQEHYDLSKARRSRRLTSLRLYSSLHRSACVKLDSEDGLFIATKAFIPTHNTTLAIETLASAQKQGGVGLFVDFEHAMDARYGRALGLSLDPSLFIYAQPEYLEQGAQIVDEFVSNSLVDLVVIDSVAAMMPKSEFEGEPDPSGGTQKGQQALGISQFLSRITKKISKGRRPALVLLNQTRSSMDFTRTRLHSTDQAAGGKALRFYTSLRLRLEVLKSEGADQRNQRSPIDQTYTQNRIRVEAVKNKIAPPFVRGKIIIEYGKGINNPASIAELAEEKLGIFSGSGFFSYQGLTQETTVQGRGQRALLKASPGQPSSI